ncbi:hypothetical protein [Pseudomonas rustica]|uniref:Uncharacterized protein n=1 Tax=Pseudomonas rustica TaxID=2827099 RepID=A0ABS5N020_9PSED|nr:hypothetical protein [Pseudomonas rustica]MBS4079914.1 hypothetical protein [Pseudomonas rustica]
MSYFKTAIWLPMVVLPALLLLDALYFSSPLRGGMEQFVLIYVLGFGLVAYVLFAVFSTRLISRRTELEVVRLTWWAPVVFIPFYGVPWVVYGIGCLAFGRLAGLGMMFLWLTYIPYVLVVGAFFSVVTVVAFKVLSKFLLFSEKR